MIARAEWFPSALVASSAEQSAECQQVARMLVELARGRGGHLLRRVLLDAARNAARAAGLYRLAVNAAPWPGLVLTYRERAYLALCGRSSVWTGPIPEAHR